MDKIRSQTESRELEKMLEEMQAALLEEDGTGQSVAPRLQSAQELFSLIERVREYESNVTAEQGTGASIPSNTGPAGHDPTRRAGRPTAVESPPSGLLGAAERLGRFEIVRRLGEGGFGLVFLARDPKLDRQVAIKVPRPEAIVTEQVRQRFLTEARAAALLSHPHIVPVFEIAELGPVCFIVSQYIDGCTLSEWLEQQAGPVPPRVAARILEPLADAVQHAHRRGVLHRDLKPSNVLFDQKPAWGVIEPPQEGELLPGVPMITDFGLAKLESDPSGLTQRGDVLGTPSYMAPEQADSRQPVSAAADIYSLGAILYRLLTGQKPHQKDTVAETLRAVQEQEPIAPRTLQTGIPRDLEAICLKCLEKSPRQRYSSAHELGRDLNRYLAGLPVEARRVSTLDRLARWAARNPALALSLTSLLLLLVGGLITVSGLLLRSNRLYGRAERLRADAISTTADLQNAVDEMLLALANMPEIEAAGFESVRHRLLERSHAYYEQIATGQPLDPEVRRRHAATLMKLARVKSKLGDHAGAADLAKEYLGKLPETGVRGKEDQLARGQSLVFLANETASSSPAESEQFLAQALVLGEKLANQPRPTTRDEMELALIYKGIADAYGVLGERTESIRYIEEALRWWHRVDWPSIEDPEMKIGLGKTLIAAAVLYSQAEESEKGQEACRLMIEFYDQLAENQEATDNMLYDLARAYRVLCWYQSKQLDEATRSAEKAQEILAGLIARHPLVPSYRKLLMGLQYSQGLNHYFAKQYDASAQFLQTNISDIEEALQRFPEEEAQFLARLSDSLTMLGIIRKYQQDSVGRFEVLTQSEAVSRRRFELSGGSNSAAVSLAGVEAELSKCLFQNGDLDDAFARIIESNRRLTAVIEADPQNGEARRYLSNGLVHQAEMLAAAGRFEEAMEVVEPALGLEVEHSEFHVLHQLAILNFQLGRFSPAMENARLLHEYAARDARATRDILLMFSRQLELLDELDDQRRPDSTQYQEDYSRLAEYGTGIIRSLLQSAEDPDSFLHDLEAEEGLSVLRRTPEYRAWRESL